MYTKLKCPWCCLLMIVLVDVKDHCPRCGHAVNCLPAECDCERCKAAAVLSVPLPSPTGDRPS